MSTPGGRLGVTALAVMAPDLVWLVADPALGHRLRITDGDRTPGIGAVPVVVAALLASLSGWALLAALERFGVRRGRAIWSGAAGVVLAISFLPFIGDSMERSRTGFGDGSCPGATVGRMYTAVRRALTADSTGSPTMSVRDGSAPPPGGSASMPVHAGANAVMTTHSTAIDTDDGAAPARLASRPPDNCAISTPDLALPTQVAPQASPGIQPLPQARY